MKSTLRLAVVAIATFAMGAVIYACEKESKGAAPADAAGAAPAARNLLANAEGSDSAAGCPHAAKVKAEGTGSCADKAEGAGCCAGKAAAMRAKHEEGGADCAHAKAKAEEPGCGAAKAAAMQVKNEGGAADCPHAKAQAASLAEYQDPDGGCMSGSSASTSQRAALEKGAKVTLVGTVLCAHCDLKESDGCKKVFRAEDGKTYTIIQNGASQKLLAETSHGEKKVEVVGTTAKDAEEPIVLLAGYKLVG
jgi:hypothetical protein